MNMTENEIAKIVVDAAYCIHVSARPLRDLDAVTNFDAEFIRDGIRVVNGLPEDQERRHPCLSFAPSRLCAFAQKPQSASEGICSDARATAVAVGMALTGHPPHGSVREALPHTALTSGF
jgi:hypothetical protein